MNKATPSFSSNGFVSAMTTNNIRTTNGMPTNSTSSERVLDMFFKQGGLRSNPMEILSYFQPALQEDKLLAMKCMFYNRDVRGGQGERATFRNMLKWLAENELDLVKKNIKLVPEYGRWDDLFVLFGTKCWTNALYLIAEALVAKNKLCAKWMPREGKKNFSTVGKSLMTFLKMTPRQYRKLLANCTEVVETKMCTNNWDEINFSHVPSQASNKYRKSFLRHDADRFNQFIQDVKAGKTKINSSALFPSDIVHSFYTAQSYFSDGLCVSKSEREAINVQWKALPDYMPKGKRILPICDLSGSMMGQPMEVSMSLGIYLSERNEGPYKDAFITFSGNPTFRYLTGDVVNRVTEMKKNRIAENTDLNKVFNLILDKAVASNLPESEMPETLLIISDMQFDSSMDNYNESAIQMINRKYARAGYRVPNIVFWNVSSGAGVPVKYNQFGVALVSGFSPSIMKNILMGEMSPEKVMLKTLNNERYSQVVV